MKPTGPEHLKFWTERLEEFWPCFVYVIRAGGPIKVGVAHNVPGRLRTLQTGNPYRFELLYVLPGAHDLEWQLHKRIEPNRTDGGAEWFDGELIPAFLEFVDALALRMAAAYQDDGFAPSWKLLMEGRRIKGRGKSSDVVVRHIEPFPLSPEELEALRARDAYEADIERQRRDRIRRADPHLA